MAAHVSSAQQHNLCWDAEQESRYNCSLRFGPNLYFLVEQRKVKYRCLPSKLLICNHLTDYPNSGTDYPFYPQRKWSMGTSNWIHWYVWFKGKKWEYVRVGPTTHTALSHHLKRKWGIGNNSMKHGQIHVSDISFSCGRQGFVCFKRYIRWLGSQEIKPRSPVKFRNKMKSKTGGERISLLSLLLMIILKTVAHT